MQETCGVSDDLVSTKLAPKKFGSNVVELDQTMILCNWRGEMAGTLCAYVERLDGQASFSDYLLGGWASAAFKRKAVNSMLYPHR